MTITLQQRESFLYSQGWHKDLPESERERIENMFDDEDIEMALMLGF